MTSTSEHRFVILEHDTEPHHFDLMLEVEGQDPLWTWAFYRTDLPDAPDELPLERLPDHRNAYLTYEGPVSGERGSVSRVEEGTWTPTAPPDSDEPIEGTFHGTTWTTSFTLHRTDRTGPRNHPLWILTTPDAR